MLVLINECYGGFSFSEEFKEMLFERHPKRYTYERFWEMEHRANPDVVALFQEVGCERASGKHSKLVVKEVPDELKRFYVVCEYDGKESIHVDWKKAFYHLANMEDDESRAAFIRSINNFPTCNIKKN